MELTEIFAAIGVAFLTYQTLDLIKWLYIKTKATRHFIIFFQIVSQDGTWANGSMTQSGRYPNRDEVRDHVNTVHDKPIKALNITGINEVSKQDTIDFAKDNN